MTRCYSLSVLCLTFTLALGGCARVTATTIKDVVLGTVEISEIIDKATGRPIAVNNITLTWKSDNGRVLDKQEYKDRASLRTTIPADGKTRLWITVTSPGYKSWSNAIRMKLNNDKTLYISVEMEQQVGIQG